MASSISRFFTALFLLCCFCSLNGCRAQTVFGSDITTDVPPSILLIVVDDMGLTDMGAFGSEIATPNLDRLAFAGIRLTNLHAAPTCSPTRAMLLSGVDHHLAGMGNMSEDMTTNQVGKPGYEGYLNDRVIPLPELLYKGGYHTYMVGKWHLGDVAHALPSQNGFEKSFALVNGGASHLNNLPIVGPGVAHYVEDGVTSPIPEDFYSTEFYANKMIEFIRSKPEDGRPFFGYLAFTAPHWPLQAPEASIRKQSGRYDSGYEALYATRLQRFVQLGLADPEIIDSARKMFTTAWDSLSDHDQRVEARRMQIYAAMIADIDIYVGKVLDVIEQVGLRDDTIVIFLSDNGPEGNIVDVGWEQLTQWIAQCCDNSYANMGAGNSYLWLGASWASAVAGPVGRYKGWTHQGGIRVPGFVYFPDLQANGRIDNTFLHVVDVYPTVLEMAGLKYPGAKYRGGSIASLHGRSWLPLLVGDEQSGKLLDERAFAWELFGKRAVRRGPWKLISYPPPHGDGQWQLYNLNSDPLESVDLASEYPQIVSKLGPLWDKYASDNGVILPNRPLLY